MAVAYTRYSYAQLVRELHGDTGKSPVIAVKMQSFLQCEPVG